MGFSATFTFHSKHSNDFRSFRILDRTLVITVFDKIPLLSTSAGKSVKWQLIYEIVVSLLRKRLDFLHWYGYHHKCVDAGLCAYTYCVYTLACVGLKADANFGRGASVFIIFCSVLTITYKRTRLNYLTIF